MLEQANREIGMNDTPQPSRVSRQELYKQVWETPMMRLGKQYGISGNGLKKICRRLKIPFPPPGYWAKLQFGKPVKLTPLPDADVNTPEHERRMVEDRRDRIRWGTSVPTKPVTKLERRQQRFLSTLYTELEKRGFKIKGTAPHAVSSKSVGKSSNSNGANAFERCGDR
jgi:hypothetical protein